MLEINSYSSLNNSLENNIRLELRRFRFIVCQTKLGNKAVVAQTVMAEDGYSNAYICYSESNSFVFKDLKELVNESDIRCVIGGCDTMTFN